MSISEEILSGFQAMNITLDQQVIAKCTSLCSTYNIDAEDFIDQWLAYTASNLNGAPPSLDALDRMERRELKKQHSTSRTPKSIRTSEVISTPPVKRSVHQEISVESPIRTPTVEPLVAETPSKNFTQRSDARSVQLEFGNCSSDCFKERCSEMLIIKVLNEEMTNRMYMYEKFLAKQNSINEMTRFVVNEIINKQGLQLTEEALKDYSGEMVICGRVYSEHPGKLNSQSILLEGLLELYKGQVVKLSVSNLERFILFSGQSVVVKGNNVKSYFVAKEIYTEAPLPPPESPIQVAEKLQIVVAAGPFTLPNNLAYEPLEELLKYVMEFKPNMLILMGPFLEASHPFLNNINQNYDSFFENIVEGIMEKLKGSRVQVVIIPSHKDVHNHVIFPTLPYQIRKRHENLILAPNPFVLDVQGLTIAGSCMDILFHLSKTEFYKDSQQKAPTDRMSRLVSHLFNQRSFYPLYPPDTGVRIDYELLRRHGMLKSLPDLMILPSTFKHFVKVVSDCVVLNPERLIKGDYAGVFAKVEVRPGGARIAERISCQILRL